MTFLSLLSLIALLAGVFLIGFGIRGTQTFTDKIVEGVTGHYPKRTLWLLIGGGALILMGIVLFFIEKNT